MTTRRMTHRLARKLYGFPTEEKEEHTREPARHKKQKVCVICGRVNSERRFYCQGCGKRLPKVTLNVGDNAEMMPELTEKSDIVTDTQQ